MKLEVGMKVRLFNYAGSHWTPKMHQYLGSEVTIKTLENDCRIVSFEECPKYKFLDSDIQSIFSPKGVTVEDLTGGSEVILKSCGDVWTMEW